MIRNYLEGQEVKILGYLQDNKATTDELLEKVGLTPTDLARFGLNKTLLLRHLPELKTKQLVIGKLIHKKGRPGNYYSITPLGTILLFKHRLENKKDDEQYVEIEKIRNNYPLITKYWDEDLVELDEYRYQSLLSAIENFEIKSRAENYISFALTLPSERNFITFEKNYLLVTTSNEKDDQIKNLLELNNVKPYIISEIESDLRDFITFQFYYNLTYQPKKTLKLIQKLKDLVKDKKISKKEYHQNLIKHAEKYKKYLGYGFNLNDSIKLENEIIQRSNKILNIITRIIGDNKNLQKLITKQNSNINSMYDSMLHF